MLQKRRVGGLADSRWARPQSGGRRKSFDGGLGWSRSSLTVSTPASYGRSLSAHSSTGTKSPTADLPTTKKATKAAESSTNRASIAPPTATSADGGSRALSAPQELVRYTKIVRRLKWKLPYLAAGYQRANAAVQKNGPDPDGDDDAVEAELMFKLDFYEYYMLLERALVHLLGVFGIVISSNAAMLSLGVKEAANGRSANGESGWASTHRYHHNVLAALDAADNPLHEALGTGEVRSCLARAKDLRNRWKYADEQLDRQALPLERYDLEGMLQSIFDGFDLGYRVAAAYVDDDRRNMAKGSLAGVGGADEQEQWDFMVDAMDWEAV